MIDYLIETNQVVQYVSILVLCTFSIFCPFSCYVLKTEYDNSIIDVFIKILNRHKFTSILLFPIVLIGFIDVVLCVLLYKLITLPLNIDKRLISTEPSSTPIDNHNNKCYTWEIEDNSIDALLLNLDNAAFEMKGGYGGGLIKPREPDPDNTCGYIKYMQFELLVKEKQAKGAIMLMSAVDYIGNRPILFQSMAYTLETLFSHLYYIFENDNDSLNSEIIKCADLLNSVVTSFTELEQKQLQEVESKRLEIVDHYKREFESTYCILQDFWSGTGKGGNDDEKSRYSNIE